MSKIMPVFILLLILLCNSCGEAERERNDEAKKDTIGKCDSCRDDRLKKHFYSWYSDIDSCGNLKVIRGEKIDLIMDVDSAIKYLNSSNQVKIERYDAHADTLYIKIINAELYTQRMGTTGASQYMLSALYTLTDHFGYQTIYFNYEEGDHGGQPGFKNRNKPGVQLPDIICK